MVSLFTSFTEEELAQAVAAFEQTGSKTAAAQQLGISPDTVRRRLKRAAEKGLMGFQPVLEGFHVSSVSTQQDAKGVVEKSWVKQTPEAPEGEKFSLPEGHIIKGVSALLDPDGRELAKWVKTREDGTQIDWPAAFKAAAAEYEGRAIPLPAPSHSSPDTTNFLNLIPVCDLHVNLLCWERDVGQNWDLKLAERILGEAFDTVIQSARPASTAIILGGGDLMHNDNNENRTAKSGNVLDADGRHQKGMEVTLRLMVRIIDHALINHDKVVVRSLKGNHDEQSSVAIGYFLYAWFKSEPRVTVDLDASLFWYHRFGKVMLAATHGHTVKLKDMPAIMAHRRAEMWGATKYRYCHGFHVHHKEVLAKEGEGVICESHQAPIPQDAWHFGSGYLSGRSVQVITYHKELGEYARRREAIQDAIITKNRNFLEAA